MRRALGFTWLVIVGGCGWTLPAPDVRRTDAAADAPADAHRADVAALDAADAAAPDVATPTDLPRPDAGFDAGVDAGFDGGRADVVVADVGFDRPAVIDAGFVDAPVDVGATVDVPAVDLGVDTGVVSCTSGDRRSCYPGSAASRGQGYCHDGVETCDATGRWPGTCVNAAVPDCTGRACGSDDCGGTCGAGCAAGQVCDDLGHCAVPSCGAGNFTVPCGTGVCPSNSNCTADDRCACLSGYVARTCAGVDCGLDCDFPDWYCARASFCAAGAIQCAGGFTCPRHAVCNEAARSCVCGAGFVAVTCAGDRCSSCPGTDYRCVPAT